MSRYVGLTLAVALVGGCVDSSAPPLPPERATTSGADESTTDEGDGSTTADETTTSAGDESSSSDDAADESSGGPLCPNGDGPALSTAPAPAGSLIDDPSAEWPETVEGLGVYPAAPDLSIVADVALHYEPTWPLWTNGSHKHRYLVLPEGASIDTSDPDAWTLPPGTLVFKTFLYPDGVMGCDRPVETRVLRKRDNGTWDYAAYGWEPDGAPGARLDIDEPTPIPVSGPDGPFEHHVPARIECRSCHESSYGELLGVSRMQLSSRLDELESAGVLSVPNEPDVIEGRDETTVAVLGVFQANCVHCHNGSGGPSSSFDLRWAVALENTIDVPSDSSASAGGIRIVPGSPSESLLFEAYSGETDDPSVKLMPPVGVDVRDAASIELLRGFIRRLEDED